MAAGCSDGGFTNQFDWFLKLLELIPSLRKLADELRELWLKITNPDTPSWKRGVILLALLEAIAGLPIEAPVILAMRLALLVAFVETSDAQRDGSQAGAQ